VKLTIRQLLSGYEVLGKLATANLPVVTSYRLNKLFRRIPGELEEYERARISLVEKYAEVPVEPEDESKIRKVAPENQEKFREELDLVLDEVVEIPFTLVKPEDLGKFEISPIELQLVDFIFAEDAAEEPQAEKPKARNRGRKPRAKQE
jgi:hypothetical protein